MVDTQEVETLLVLLDKKIHPYGRDEDFLRESELRGSKVRTPFIRRSTNSFGSTMYAISQDGIDQLKKTIVYYKQILEKILASATLKTMRTIIAKEMMIAYRMEISAMICPESSTRFVETLKKCFKNRGNIPALHNAAKSVKNALKFNAMASKGVMLCADALYNAIYSDPKLNRQEMIEKVVRAVEGSIVSYINVNVAEDKNANDKQLYYEVNGWMLAVERIAGTLHRNNQRGYSIVWEKEIVISPKGKNSRTIMGGDLVSVTKHLDTTSGLVMGMQGGKITIASSDKGIVSLSIERLQCDVQFGKLSIKIK